MRLRDAVNQAKDWTELSKLMEITDDAYNNKKISLEQAEHLARLATERSRQIPPVAGQAADAAGGDVRVVPDDTHRAVAAL